MRILKTTLFFVLFFLTLSEVFAVPVRNLDSTSVVVADRSQQSFQDALPQAFGQVMIKISGNTGVMTLPQIQNMLSDVKDYVVRYDYETQPDATGQQQLILHIVFDEKAIRQLLKNVGQAMWSSDRPLTLVWLYQSNLGELELLTQDTNGGFASALQQQASARGIDIIFPTMDLQDQENLTVTKGSHPPFAMLRAEAKRYGVSSVLVGVIDAASEEQVTNIHWRFVLNKTTSRWKTHGEGSGAALTAGINRLANMMASRYAAMDSKNLQSQIIMQVDGVNNLEDYGAVLSALRHLPIVSHVAIQDTHNDVMLLAIKVAGGEAPLVSALKSFNRLEPNSAAAEKDATSEVSLYYRWAAKRKS